MIVYGDPSFTAPLGERIDELCDAFAACAQSPSLDAWRALVIRAGQLEQAVFDAPADVLVVPLADELRAWCHAATAEAAKAFCEESQASRTKNLEPRTEGGKARVGLFGHRASVSLYHRVTIKVPEGFAFYALYPDQYCLAAQRWLADHADVATRRAVVVGVRSIGTTLGAVVAATLAAHGWETQSFSVRPAGHPFDREVNLGGQTGDGNTWALVVDEGPGMSGSSMAAVAQALLRAGVARERIAFFPGHMGEPGSAASDAVRDWWRTTPRYVGPLLLNGRALTDALAAATEILCSGDAVVRVDDLGGGQWRSMVYADPALWPAVCAPFERPKYLCTTQSGARVLWKFAGLAATSTENQAPKTRLPASRLPLPASRSVTAHGFVVQRWFDGTPLTYADSTPALLAQIGRYIAEAAAPPLSAEEQRAALTRLAEMLYWNVWEMLGEEQAERTRAIADAALRFADTALPAAGDGRLAPHEWLRLASGEVVKVDAEGSYSDHTVVGRQPIAWDVAGALVEWRLAPADAKLLLDAYHTAGGVILPPELLTFYRLAYAALKAGQCMMCAGMTADVAEQQRLWTAAAHYKTELYSALTYA